MSDPVSSNSQAQPAVIPAPPAGPSMEELQAKLAELEKQSEGRLRDLQDERRKRQEMEARLSPAPAPSAAAPDVTQDELGKVLDPYIKPVKAQAEAATAMLRRYEEDKAIDYLAAKLGKSKQDVLNDAKFQERFISTNKRWGVQGGSILETAMRTYDLMELEDLKQKEAERARQAQAAQAGSLPAGTPSAPLTAKKEFTKQDFESMSLLDYDKLASSGSFVEDADTGKIVFTPR